MGEYYRRDGSPMTLEEWCGAFEDTASRQIDKTTLVDGRWVSTVWLGLNHRFNDGPPLIFETMVFPSENDYGELHGERYSTEQEAREGHARIVAECEQGKHTP